MKRLTTVVVLLYAFMLFASIACAGSKTAMAMSDKKIFNYYRNVEHALRMLSTAPNVTAQYEQICGVYASVMTGMGFDFQETINHALSRLNGKDLTIASPDLRFILGLYRVPPEAFWKFGHIDKETYEKLEAFREKTKQE